MAIAGFKHLGLKAAALVLAALVWVLVAGEQTVERVLRVPIEFTNLSTDLELVGTPPEFAEARVRGSSGAIGRLSAGDLAAVLNVGGARAGLRLFHLTAADVRAPSGVEIVQVSPATLSLVFEEQASRTVEVAPRIDGEPAPGFVVSGVRVEPATVVVSGPAGAVAALGEAITEAVSVDGARQSVTEEVTVGVSDPTVRIMDIQTVRITVTLEAAPVEWTVAEIPVEVRGAAAGASVAPRTVEVDVRGPADAAGPGGAGLSASVDATGLAPGTHALTVHVDTPAGISLLRVAPPQVRVTVR